MFLLSLPATLMRLGLLLGKPPWTKKWQRCIAMVRGGWFRLDLV
jgi:hypothetical protein